MSVYEKLLKVQLETKCLKEHFNKFGGYYHRNVEDIWTAEKPVASKYGAVLTCTDRIVQIGNRYYVEATATIYDVETGESISTTANAREDESKKGMDGSQITGTASSYARKYAMGGLLGLDDTKDSDADELKDDQDNKTVGKQPNETETGDHSQPSAQKTNEDQEPNVPSIPDGIKTPPFDRKICIAECVVLAKANSKFSRAATRITESDYNGKPWESISDEGIKALKVWLCQIDRQRKKAGAA